MYDTISFIGWLYYNDEELICTEDMFSKWLCNIVVGGGIYFIIGEWNGMHIPR